MNLNASAGRGGQKPGYKSYFDHCENLNLTATSTNEALWMAALAKAITFGGTIQITPNGSGTVDVVFKGSIAPATHD